MDSDSKNARDEDSTSKHVLDYYKKYSQNKDLPKYFSGTSVSYLPEFHDNIEEGRFQEEPIVIKTNIDIIITSPEPGRVIEKEEAVGSSRASSVMSNRKLEWDNGADIGYDNCLDIKKLHKSSSLPILTDLEKKKLRLDLKPIVSTPDNQKSESSSDNDVKIVVYTQSSSSEDHCVEINNVYSSSSSPPLEEKKVICSSSSSTNDNVLSKNAGIISSSSDSSSKQRISQFASTLSYIKQKIGAPDAHSTPKYLESRKSDPELSSTPIIKIANRKDKNKRVKEASISKSEEVLIKDSSKNIEDSKRTIQNKLDIIQDTSEPIKHLKMDVKSDSKIQIVKTFSKKIVNLAITRPITVECTCSPRNLKNQVLETKTSRTTVGVQTDEISEKELIKIIQQSEVNGKNQSLMYFEYSESEKANACSTQTASDLASNCNSFEYVTNFPERERQLSSTDSSKNKEGSNQQSKIQSAVSLQQSNLKRSQRTSDLRNALSEDNSSKDFCLGKVISVNQLDSIGEDVEKSIHLLQKLIKSKKYDPVTKKRYIKKIVQKITESKYLQESSSSSDLFFPKNSKLNGFNSALKLPKQLTTDTSDEKSSKNTLQSSLASNLPWHPYSNDKVKVSPRKKLITKTFTHDILPKQVPSSKDEASSPPEIIPIDSRDPRKNLFTLTNNEFSVNHEYVNKQNVISDDIHVHQKVSSVETDNTSLEKQYESSSTSKSVNYNNWRDDKTTSEKILEEKSSSSNGNGDYIVHFAEKEREFQINWINNEISHLGRLKGLLEKPKIESAKHSKTSQEIKKRTSVYTVSEESDKPDEKGKKKRNYVIETQLGAKSSDQIKFKLEGKKYTVTEVDSKKSLDGQKTRQVLGDIEVISSESTTNIKVMTFCETCKRSPCICVCSKCSQTSCICPAKKISTAKGCICGFHKESVCLKCNKLPCECGTSTSSETTSSGSFICVFCNNVLCTCGKVEFNKKKSLAIHSNDEYTGKFIPTLALKTASGSLSIPERKFLTYPPTAKDGVIQKPNFKDIIKCVVCGLGVCICNKPKKTPSSEDGVITKSKALPKSSDQIQGDTLKRVFENCICSTQTKCKCDFVSNLVSHFNPVEVYVPPLKNVTYDTKILQTEENKCDCQHIGIQTQVRMIHQNLQTTKDALDSKISQTEDLEKCECQHIGIQAQADIKHQISQTLKEQHVITEEVITQTHLVTDTIEESKKGVTFVEKILKENSKGRNSESQTDKAILLSSEEEQNKHKSTQISVVSPKKFTSSTRSHSDSSRPSSSSKHSDSSKRGIRVSNFTQTDDKKEKDSDHSASVLKTPETSSKSSSTTGTLESANGSSSSKSSSLISCICCKEKYLPENISLLGGPNQNYPLCHKCLKKRPILTSLCYAGPDEETCTCNKPVKADLIKEIKDTVDELHDLEYCTCIKPSRKGKKYCPYCLFKLRKTAKSKNGIAYTLTLENESMRSKVRSKRKKKKVGLEEIRVKVPCPYRRKQHKDRENFSRKDGGNKASKVSVGGIGAVNDSSQSNTTSVKIIDSKKTKKSDLTLQEYLKKNRPDFIDSAEYRRQAVLSSQNEREGIKEEVKLRFLDNSLHYSRLEKENNKLFTEQEMKEITKRNYKKLPEVQKRIHNFREQRLRSADRFIVDVFARKIQSNVLKGKSSFPIDRNVISLPKTM